MLDVRAFCLVCDAWSCNCRYIGTMLVSFMKLGSVDVLCAIRLLFSRAEFCTICSLSRLVSEMH